jgi:hypothetical protein
MFQHTDIPLLAETFGIVFPGAIDYMGSQHAMDARAALLAMDAAPPNALQPQLITAGNAGIPAYLVNYLDPELTRVLTSPIKAAEIFGEAKKGDWTTLTATFPVIESAGEVASYGDYAEGGSVGANVNYEPRQSFHYQTFTRWGDRELAMAGLAKIDWAAEQNVASALAFNKFQNKSYFFGITGLDNYGWLNDPSLNSPITPGAKTAGGFTWAKGTGLEIWADIQALYKQLQSQLGGNLEMSDKMTLVMSPLVQSNLLTPMSLVYGSGNVKAYLAESFPNLTVKTAVEYSTASGELVQLFVDSVQGQKLGFCGFTEKMRAHAVVRETSATYQKKSAGTWGAILKVPAALAQLLGV